MSAFGSNERKRDGDGEEDRRRGRARQRVERPFYRHARTPAIGIGFVLYSYTQLDSVTVEWPGADGDPEYTFRDRTGAVIEDDGDWERYDTLCVSRLFFTAGSVRSGGQTARLRLLHDACRRASVRRLELEECDDYRGAVPALLREFRGIVEIQADYPSPDPFELIRFVREAGNRFSSILLDCGNGEDDWARFAAAVSANRQTLRDVYIPEPWFDDAKRDATLARQLSECPVLETVVCKIPPHRFARIVAECKLDKLREVVLNAGSFDGNGSGDDVIGWMGVLHSRFPRLEALTLIAPGVAWSHLPDVARSATRFAHLRKFSVTIGKTARDACPVESASAAFDALSRLEYIETLGIGNVPGLREFLLNKRTITTLCLESSVSRALDPRVRQLIVQRSGRIWVLDAYQEVPDPDVEAAVMDRRPTLALLDEVMGHTPWVAEMILSLVPVADSSGGRARDRYGPIEPDSPGIGDDA